MLMEKTKFELNALTLHILAMFCMLLDHMWATVVSGQYWMTCVGRLAFPIFAFMIAEGFFRTSDLKKYLLRLFVFAVLSEIPFNLMSGGSLLYPYHQNVLWTFLIALLAMTAMEKIRQKQKFLLSVVSTAGITVLACFLGLVTMTDYNAAGVFMVLLFYFFRGRTWKHFLGQFIGLYWVNVLVIGGMDIPLSLFGTEFFLPSQAFALLALLPIWLYRGKQGPHNKAIQYACYAFYPVHILLLGLMGIWG